MPQDPFWNPVMGAVDMLTKDVMRKRELYQRAQQQLALREEERQHQITVRDEEREHGRQKAGFTARMGYLDELGRDSTITDKSKEDIGQARLKMIGEMEAGAPVSDTEELDITRRTRKLSPEVAEYFEGEIDTTQPMPLKVAESLEDQFYAQEKDRRAGEAFEVDKSHKEKMAKASQTRAQVALERVRRDRGLKKEELETKEVQRVVETIDDLKEAALEDLKWEDSPKAKEFIDFLDDARLRVERGEDPNIVLKELKTYGEFLMGDKKEGGGLPKWMLSIGKMIKGSTRKTKTGETGKQDLTY